MSPEASLIVARGLAAGYGRGQAALENVSFEAQPGQLIAVLGPNGGGKTTLFRALLGEVPWRRGDVTLSGEVAYVPQTERSRLDFPVNALDVVLMGTYARLPWHRRTGSAERAAARSALAQVGLDGQERVSYGALSGGQRQRVLIARALAQRTEILLLDEPLSGVDEPSAARILAVLRELRDEGRAILVATHDIDEARRSDRVLCLNRRQVAFGSPPDVLTVETLAETYGEELVALPGGERAVVVHHHAH